MCELTVNERSYLLDAMVELLDEYDYEYTKAALSDILDEWAYQKSELIEAFKKHPNYVDGKFLIAFDYNYERGFDGSVFKRFMDYIDTVSIVLKDDIPEEMIRQRELECCYQLPNELYNFLCMYLYKHITSRTITEVTAKLLEKIIPQIHPHAGEKSSRVINRICTYLGYNKHPDYNREFAKFADGLSPMTIKRHTVLSINPLDYLTMSFGNSWASCHTIDKANKRNMPNSYSGQYSSGTMSYMLDGSSMVFYTVDSEYDGKDYWTQPKINRQMFHYGEDKLVQGRLYPQDNDNDSEVYAPYRNIVQSIMATIFDFPNYWTLKRGTDAARLYIQTKGTHYTDYCYYQNCSLSRIKDNTNENTFVVGASPICIQCGERHDVQTNINHCCSGYICADCGYRIEDEENVYEIDGSYYCCDCATYCDCCNEYVRSGATRWVESDDRYVCDACIEEYYERCEYCDEWHYREDMHEVDSTGGYVCDHCRDNYYSRCADCGELFQDDDMHEGSDGEWYCGDCIESHMDNEEEEEE